MELFKNFGKWSNASIRRKLLIWTIGFWIISVTALSLTIYTIGQAQSVRQTRERNVQFASIISKDINAQLTNVLSDIRTFSTHLELTDAGLIPQADAFLSLRLSSPHRYLGVYAFDYSGNLLLHLTDSQTSLLHLTGADIAFRPRIAVPKEVTGAYNGTFENRTFVSDVYFTQMEQTPIIYIGIPLTFTSGETRTVIFEVGLQDIWQRIEMRSFGQSGFTYAVSREGIIIAHPDQSHIRQPAPVEVKSVTQGFEGFTTYEDEQSHQEIIAAYSPVGGFTGWGVIVAQDSAEAYAPILTLGLIVVGIWICLAPLGIIGIMVLIRNFTSPILILTRTAQGIANTGDLTKTTTLHRHDEVGQMSQAFDQMIERLQQSEDKAANAATEERTRLARDLHDAVSQTLFSASMISEVLPKIWEKNPEEGKRRLEEVRQLTRGALAEMRTLLFELRPAALADAELGYLLRQLAESISGRTRIAIGIQIDGICNPTSDVKIALYRITQEALNNVGKHSGATKASINMICQEGSIIVKVSDNGRGFDISNIKAGSLGVGIMRERAKKIGATVEIESKNGDGTTVIVSWHGNDSSCKT
jgi:signal transduction histidine kinase